MHVLMNEPEWHFIAMIACSWLLFAGLVWLVLGAEHPHGELIRIIGVTGIITVGGMLFGKYGANAGLPWWIYYSLPMLATVCGPPILFKMRRTQILLYLIGSILIAPLIHAAFSFFLGWNEYMPFWKIPYWKSL